MPSSKLTNLPKLPKPLKPPCPPEALPRRVNADSVGPIVAACSGKHTTLPAQAELEVNAAERHLLCCIRCGLLSHEPLIQGNQRSRCPRCHSRLALRKPDSVRRTWAFLLAGYAMYIPANVLPIMEARSLQDAQIDTIMSGVIYLWQSGSRELAAIVFTASILVPSFKLLGLSWLTFTVQRGESRWRRQRLRLYRFIDLIGRWSMLDIYVVALLVALVQLQLFATVKAGPAAVAFGAVVVLTLLAASNFDPRLIWDEKKHD
jgi:paraquat-inducible protein A